MDEQQDRRRRARDEDGRARGRIVVGFDGSAGARAALVLAIGEAARRDAGIDVVTVRRVVLPWTMGPPVMVPDVEAVLDDDRRRARTAFEEARTDPALRQVAGIDAVRARVLTVEGAPAQALVDHAEGADLLVVGSRGRGAVRSALLGSVALHCVTHAACPVTVVHGRPDEQVPGAPVVVGLDGSGESLAACRLAIEEAARLAVDVEVVAAYAMADYWTDLRSPGPSPERLRAVVQQRAEEFAAHAREAARFADGTRTPEVRVHAVEGAAQEVLVQRGRGASLVVVGSRGRSAIRGLLLGSVALHVAVSAQCPVLVVHEADPVPAESEAIALSGR